MRTLAALGAISALFLVTAPTALALPKKPYRAYGGGHAVAAQSQLQRISSLLLKTAARHSHALRPHRSSAPASLLSSLEADIVSRINAQRGARGLRALRVSRGLTRAASYHSHEMGLLGFFEHESRNGAAFWRRLERFYPAGRGYWSVGENIFWESPDTSGSSTVHEWMISPPHRQRKKPQNP